MENPLIPRRPLHHGSDIKVTAIGMGAASLGNVYGALTEEKKTENIHTAFKAGINYFDTSPFYGGTTSEYYLGRAIRDLPRSEIVLATKVGRFTNPPDAVGKSGGGGGWFDFSRAAIEKSVKESMARLGTSFIDIYQLHDAEHAEPEVIINEALPAMDALRRAGMIGAIGINGYPLEMFPVLLQGAREKGIRVDTIFTYGQNTIQCSRMQSLYSFIKQYDVGILHGSPLQLGFLTDAPIQDWLDVTAEMQEARRTAQELCHASGTTLATIALKYSFANDSDIVLSTVTGGRTAEETQTSVEAYTQSRQGLTSEETKLISQLREIFESLPSGRGKLDQQWPAHSGHKTYYFYPNSDAWADTTPTI